MPCRRRRGEPCHVPTSNVSRPRLFVGMILILIFAEDALLQCLGCSSLQGCFKLMGCK